jgi:hypothetical protein
LAVHLIYLKKTLLSLSVNPKLELGVKSQRQKLELSKASANHYLERGMTKAVTQPVWHWFRLYLIAGGYS